MRLGSDHVVVRVPATSANLGPGFDALGLALGVHDEVEVRALGSAEVLVEVEGEGATDVPRGEEHLVVRALRAALDHVGAPQTGLHLRCRNSVPHGRGMGSSAAATVAGVLAARMLLADPEALDDDVALELATAMEGHPDNAAPALLGGATVAWTHDGRPHAVRLALQDDILPLVLVPDVRCATRTARGVLPPAVPHGDAAHAAGRAALLVHALTRDPSLLLPATEDRLHQDYRAEVLASSMGVLDALRSAGLAATVSGAGPALLVLTVASEGDRADTIVRHVLGARPGETWTVLRPGVGGPALAHRVPDRPDDPTGTTGGA